MQRPSFPHLLGSFPKLSLKFPLVIASDVTRKSVLPPRAGRDGILILSGVRSSSIKIMPMDEGMSNGQLFSRYNFKNLWR